MTDLVSARLVQRLEEIEADATEDWSRAAPAALAASLGLSAVREGGVLAAMAARVDVLSFNAVLLMGVGAPASEATLDRIIARYRASGAARFMVQLAPTAQPPELEGWLLARGFVHHNNWARLHLEIGPPPRVATDLRVERIGPEHAATFAEIVATSFKMPEAAQPWIASLVGRDRWRHYMAFDGDEPVATAALFAPGEIGWLGAASTRATHRGRGAQSALIARRIEDGARLGCTLLSVETAEDKPEKPAPSFRNLTRLGFTFDYLRRNFVPGPAKPG